MDGQTWSVFLIGLASACAGISIPFRVTFAILTNKKGHFPSGSRLEPMVASCCAIGTAAFGVGLMMSVGGPTAANTSAVLCSTQGVLLLTGMLISTLSYCGLAALNAFRAVADDAVALVNVATVPAFAVLVTVPCVPLVYHQATPEQGHPWCSVRLSESSVDWGLLSMVVLPQLVVVVLYVLAVYNANQRKAYHDLVTAATNRYLVVLLSLSLLSMISAVLANVDGVRTSGWFMLFSCIMVQTTYLLERTWNGQLGQRTPQEPDLEPDPAKASLLQNATGAASGP